MNVIEDVVSRKNEFHVEDTSKAYSEIRDLLDNKLSFDDVNEVKYFNDVDTGTVRAKIETLEVYDDYYSERLEIFITIKENLLKIEVKGMLTASYDTTGWKDNIAYYGYRAIFHRLIGIKNEHSYESFVEDKVDQLLRNLERIF